MIYQIDNREVIIENKTIIEMRFIEGSWKPFKNRFDKDKEYFKTINERVNSFVNPLKNFESFSN